MNRRAGEGLSGIAIGGVIVCAIGTLSLEPLGANIGPLVIGRRIFRQHWFEHSIAESSRSRRRCSRWD